MDKQIRVLTLWQPWASWVGIIKYHETRCWRTNYRGLLIIHAAKRPIDTLGQQLQSEMLERLLAIQAEINATPNRPNIDLINTDEEAFIRQCLADKVYPDKWDGTEPIGTTWIDEPIGDSGMIQPLLFQQWS